MNYLSKVKSFEHIMNLTGNFPQVVGDVNIENDRAVFQNDTLKVTAAFTNHAHGVMERADTIENISGKPLCIRTALPRFCLNGGEYEVYTQYSQWSGESRGTWQPLYTSVCARNNDIRANTSASPFVAVFNQQTGRGIAFHILADAMWQFEVCKHVVTTENRRVRVELGMNNSNLALSLAPGQVLTLPRILYYEFTNKTDMDAYRLHRYCKDIYRPKDFPVVYNTWMFKFDQASLEELTEQVMKAKELGVEYFVMDSGWYGAPYIWADSVGDWEESACSRLQGQLLELADRVRKAGMKFGLWFEIERAALRSKAANAYPQYYIFQNGNAFIDFGNPEACDYIYDILARNIRYYGVEYIKFDFNRPLTYDEEQTAFSKYFAGYRAFIARLGKEFPHVYLQNCASGGMRMGLASLQGFDSFWISDNHSIYAQLEIFKNTLVRMPSRALETWMCIRSFENFEPVEQGGSVEKIISTGDFCWGQLETVPEDFLFASVLGAPIGLSFDLTKLSTHTFGKLQQFIAEFKKDRSFWMESECHILCDTPRMLILQFCDENYDRIKVCVFGKNPDQNHVTVYPICTADAVYTHTNGTAYTTEFLTTEGIDIPVDGICAATFDLLKK